MVEIEEISNGGGAGPVSAARLQCEPRLESRGALPRAPDLTPSAEVSWFLLLEGGRTKSPGCVAECAGGERGHGLRVPRSTRALLGRFPFPREKGTEKGTEENVAGAEWKTRHLPEVWFYVWFEWRARARSFGGMSSTSGAKNRIPLWTGPNPTRSFFDPILPFLRSFLERDV